jgi:hypothetical protein
MIYAARNSEKPNRAVPELVPTTSRRWQLATGTVEFL